MKPILKTYGLTILSGVLLALAFPSWNLFPLAWVALIPLFYRARDLQPRAAFGHFLLAGWVFNSILLHWLMTNVYWAGGWAFWGYQVLCIVMALFWAVMGLAWSWMRGRVPQLGGPLTLAILWAAMECLQARLFSGFGWGAIAYSQGPDLPVIQLASLGSASFVSAIIVLFNALIAFAIPSDLKSKIQNPKSKILLGLAALVLLAAAHAIGALLLAEPDYTSKPFRVGVLQTDFPLEMKWDWEYSEEMVRNAVEKSRSLAKHEKVDLFVWPESAIMDEITVPGIHDLVTGLTTDTGASLFTGAQRRNEKTGGYPNSSYLFDNRGQIAGYYDKVRLVAFGEYVPFGKYLPFIQRVVPAIGDVAFGEGPKTFPVKGRTLGPLICFEVLFTDMADTLRAMGADFLVVITNLAWFGESSAIPQEFELARMRAIETRLPVVHCANTGISGVFDPWGRFTMVNAAFGPSGRYVKLRADLEPRQLIMQRVGGVLPVAAPAGQPIPSAPRYFSLVAIILSGLLLAAATFLPRMGSIRRK